MIDYCPAELFRNVFMISDHTDEKDIDTAVTVADYATCMRILRESENKNGT